MRIALGRNLAPIVVVLGLAVVAEPPAVAQRQDRPEMSQATEKATGKGVIKGVNKEDRQLQIAHEAIPALTWPAMTMAFKIAPGVSLEGLSPGDKITFTLSKSPQGGFVIEELKRAD